MKNIYLIEFLLAVLLPILGVVGVSAMRDIFESQLSIIGIDVLWFVLGAMVIALFINTILCLRVAIKENNKQLILLFSLFLILFSYFLLVNTIF